MFLGLFDKISLILSFPCLLNPNSEGILSKIGSIKSIDFSMFSVISLAKLLYLFEFAKLRILFVIGEFKIDLLLNNEKRELFEQESYNLYQASFNIENNINQLENIYNKVLVKN